MFIFLLIACRVAKSATKFQAIYFNLTILQRLQSHLRYGVRCLTWKRCSNGSHTCLSVSFVLYSIRGHKEAEYMLFRSFFYNYLRLLIEAIINLGELMSIACACGSK